MSIREHVQDQLDQHREITEEDVQRVLSLNKVSDKKLQENWDRIFKKKISKEEYDEVVASMYTLKEKLPNADLSKV